MAIPTSAIQALLQAKAQMGVAPIAPTPFPSTDPTAVGSMLAPLQQAQQTDQAALVQEQQTAASGAMTMLLNSLAAGPNPAAAAAQGGPARPASSPAVGPNSTPQAAASGY